MAMLIIEEALTANMHLTSVHSTTICVVLAEFHQNFVGRKRCSIMQFKTRKCFATEMLF